MCGIIGYVGRRPCAPLLMQGLTQLEYRGYDSAGLTLAESEGPALAPRDRAARQPIAIASEGNEAIQHLVDDVIYVPRAHSLLQPLLAILPLQLLAHRIARLRGLNVDQPRNLAKTVTVE